MFGNLFFVSKKKISIFETKKLIGNPKWTKNKNYSQNSICEEN